MKHKIQGLQLIVSTDTTPSVPYLELALQAILGGIDGIQFRHKGIYSRETYSLVSQLAELCNRFSIPLIINDRIDIALAVKAAGAHLGQSDLPLAIASAFLGKGKIIGATASTLEEAKRAEIEGADYIGFGHIFPTTTKIKNTPPVGLEGLKAVLNHVTIPVVAIGGITDHNLDEVRKTGVHGVAFVSAISSSLDPFRQTKKLKHTWSSFKSS